VVRPTLGGFPSGKWLLVAFGSVALSFLFGTWFSESKNQEIRSAARSIASNASPSLQLLSSAHSELRHIAVLIDDYVDRSAAGIGVPPLRELVAARKKMDSDWAHYLTLPSYRDEIDLQPLAQREKLRLDAAIDRTLTRVSASDLEGALSLLESDVKPQIDGLDAAFTALSMKNADAATALAARIDELQRRSLVSVVVLDSLSLALTIFAAVLAVRVIRRYTLLIERRADELDQFAGRVAHDILSPLAALKLTLDVLRGRSDLDPRSRRIAGEGATTIDRVKEICDGLLDFARAGAAPVAGAQSEVRQVLDDVLQELAPVAASAGVELHGEAPDDLRVACGPAILTVIWSNLLNNAIKYVGDGPQRRVRARARSSGAFVHCDVEDTGPGIPAHYRSLVFEPYLRAPGLKQAGIGLGLATVKRLTEVYGGRVGVNDALGGGSQFWFELPRAPAPARVTRPAIGDPLS
jgi:signal transduction histidine kinase